MAYSIRKIKSDLRADFRDSLSPTKGKNRDFDDEDDDDDMDSTPKTF